MHADYITPYEQQGAVQVETGVIFTESTLLGRTKCLSEQLSQRFCQTASDSGRKLAASQSRGGAPIVLCIL